MNKLLYKTIALIIFFSLHLSCKKLLDEKSNAKLVVPSTQKDLQALLDDYSRVTIAELSSTTVSADEYYLNQTDFDSRAEEDKKLYTWEAGDIFEPQYNAWFRAYNNVYIANTVLETIDNVSKDPIDEWKSIKGQAYYLRAKSYLSLVEAFAPAYEANTSGTDLGVPLRLNTNFNQASVRASVAENFELIESDLQHAIQLLPLTPLHVVRSSKPAAFGLMARMLLYMRRYPEAGLYADSCLQIKNTLINFNTLNASATFPIAAFNTEVIMDYRSTSATLNNARAKMDSTLMQGYTTNDLRKTILYKNNNNGTYGFKGSYTGAGSCFTGIAVNEIYLIKAECLARQNRVPEAMAALNILLEKRWRTNLFVPFTASTSETAVQIILMERRKELPFRALRWMDIKRLNKEGAGITMKRKINTTTLEMQPNDLRYALPIPEDVIAITGMPRNPR